MLNIYIRRPNESDIEELHHLFYVIIKDTFGKEGLGDDIEGIKGEVEEKKRLLHNDLESNGEEQFFLIACHQGKIVGTTAYGPSGQLIDDCSNGKLKDVGEIGTVYILPEYQKSGIGTLLFNSMLIALISKNVEEFCLDSGYTIAKQIWRKKLGEPCIVMKDFWGEGFDHFIWHCKVKDIPISYNLK